jgi:hypothetical protein
MTSRNGQYRQYVNAANAAVFGTVVAGTYTVAITVVVAITVEDVAYSQVGLAIYTTSSADVVHQNGSVGLRVRKLPHAGSRVK